MRKRINYIVSSLVLLAVLLAACAAPTETAPVEPTEDMDASVSATLTAVASTAGGDTGTGIEPMSQTDLVDVIWEWSALKETMPASQSVVPNPENYTVTFSADGTLSVKADCNVAAGSYTVSGSQMTITLGPTTLAECGPESSYDQFLGLLGQVDGFGSGYGNLVLTLAEGAGEMYFQRGSQAELGVDLEPIAEVDLVNIAWQWSSLVEMLPAAQSVVPDPEKYVVIFREDNTLNITADCNVASGTYELIGTQITIQLGPTTLAFCPEDSLSEVFLVLLGNAQGIGVKGDDLVLVVPEEDAWMSFTNGGFADEASVPAKATPIPGDPELTLGTPDFIDEFDTAGNWATFDNRCFTTEISGGKLSMTGKLAITCWELTWPEIQDFYLEATVDTTENCPGDGYYGLIYRAPDANSGYLFGLTCDGRYVLISTSETGRGTLVPLTETVASNPGREQTNRLGVMAVGTTHALYINGIFVTEIADAAYTAVGQFGVAVRAGAGDVPVRVEFDKIAYWNLPYEGSAPPVVEATPTPLPGDPTSILGAPKFKDTFDNADNWTLFDADCFTSTIEDGAYVMTGKRASYCWETTWPRVENFYLETIIETTEECPANAQFGLLFRAPDTNGGYVYVISCEGKAGMGYWDGDSGAVLFPLVPSEYINAGPNQQNRIGVLAVGNDYQLYINGQLIGSLEDSTFTQAGLVGLVVRAGDGRVPVTVRFNEMSFWELQE